MQISEVELLGVPQVLSPGFLEFESYNTGGGNEVGFLTGHPTFPHQPREVLHLTSFDSRSVYPDDSHEESVNNAVGATPGLAVIDVTEGGRGGTLRAIARVSNRMGEVERADPHGLRVRRIP